MNVYKNCVAIRLSDEQIIWAKALTDSRYERRVAERIEHPITENQQAEYERAKAAWDILKDSPFFDYGCSCEHPSLIEPEPAIEYIYAETEQEWLDRCRALLKGDQ